MYFGREAARKSNSFGILAKVWGGLDHSSLFRQQLAFQLTTFSIVTCQVWLFWPIFFWRYKSAKINSQKGQNRGENQLSSKMHISVKTLLRFITCQYLLNFGIVVVLCHWTQLCQRAGILAMATKYKN